MLEIEGRNKMAKKKKKEGTFKKVKKEAIKSGRSRSSATHVAQAASDVIHDQPYATDDYGRGKRTIKDIIRAVKRTKPTKSEAAYNKAREEEKKKTKAKYGKKMAKGGKVEASSSSSSGSNPYGWPSTDARGKK